jgi:hypothetical protein
VWDLDPWPETTPEPPTTVRLLVAGQVRLAPGMLHVTPLDDAPPIMVRWASQFAATITEQAIADPMLTSVWGTTLQRVDIGVTAGNRLDLTVEMDAPTSGGHE